MTPPGPNPNLFFDTANAFQRTEALRAAVELDLFSHLAAGKSTVGRHTVCRLLRVAGSLAPGHWSSYHRVLSRRRWSTWRLAWALAEHVLARFAPRGVVSVSGEDTVTQHRGKKVHGKARHRDAVRSTTRLFEERRAEALAVNRTVTFGRRHARRAIQPRSAATRTARASSRSA